MVFSLAGNCTLDDVYALRYAYMNNFITKAWTAFVKSISLFSSGLKQLATRSFFTNLLMVGFIIFTSVGAGLVSPALGFIAAGITCGIFGFLLGLE
jgi:hypothetical protein